MVSRLALAAVLLASAAYAQPLRPTGGSASFADLLAEPASRPAGLPPGFYLETAATGLTLPVGAAFAPDGRLFVVEKAGRLSVVEDGRPRVLLDLTTEIESSQDRGLLGLAVDPGFAQNGFLYLAYTVSPDGTDGYVTNVFARVVRYRLGAQGTIDPASRHILIGETFATGIPACYFSHTIGTLEFGADGTLLVGTGDAASYATTDTGGLYDNCFGPGRLPPAENVGAFRAQQTESLSGKILRIDPATGRGLPSNPFWTGNPDDNASKVWARGFRNPFRFDVDRALGSADPAAGNPGPIYLGDVGWRVWEELSVVRRGDNHGWPCRESARVQPNGYAGTSVGQTFCAGLVSVDPTFEWHHTNASQSRPAGRRGAAIVGGAVYRGTRYPAAYRGQFLYNDYANGWMATASISAAGALAGDALFSSDAGPVVDVAYDAATQNLFWVNVATGTVSRLRHTSGDVNTPPVAAAQGAPTSGLAPLTVQFTSTGTADPDGDALTYAWAFGNGQTATGPSPSVVYPNAGAFTARLTVTDARGASSTADVPVSVRATGAPPTAAISQPALGTRALSGQTITLAATATDPDAGQTATLRYAWAVTLIHNEHQHPNAFASTSQTAPYTVPFHGDAGESYALLIRLTVTDATGLATTVERTIGIGEDGAQQDITSRGTAVAFATPAASQGSQTLATISDGFAPEPFTGDPDARARAASVRHVCRRPGARARVDRLHVRADRAPRPAPPPRRPALSRRRLVRGADRRGPAERAVGAGQRRRRRAGLPRAERPAVRGLRLHVRADARRRRPHRGPLGRLERASSRSASCACSRPAARRSARSRPAGPARTSARSTARARRALQTARSRSAAAATCGATWTISTTSTASSPATARSRRA